jgi:formylglycine-generating enzyme required for sulfatase activity
MDGGEIPEGQENYPGVVVSFFDAMAYPSAARTLPTEEQWERAARGLERLSFTWGRNGAKTRPTRCWAAAARGRADAGPLARGRRARMLFRQQCEGMDQKPICR